MTKVPIYEKIGLKDFQMNINDNFLFNNVAEFGANISLEIWLLNNLTNVY